MNACLGVRAWDHEITSGGTSGNIDFWHRAAEIVRGAQILVGQEKNLIL